jgi:hypothetical protein
MLQWPAGSRPEDGPWAKYWYKAVHASTGFSPYVEKEVKLDGELAELEAASRPYYEYIRAYRLLP